MANNYETYPSADDLPAVTLDPQTGLAKAPPPPPDAAPDKTTAGGLREWGDQPRVVTDANGGMTFVDAEPIYSSKVSGYNDAGESVPPTGYATDEVAPPKVGASGVTPEQAAPIRSDATTPVADDELVPIEPTPPGADARYGSLIDKAKTQKTADTRKGKSCDGGWYDTAVKEMQNAAGFTRKSTAKGGNPLCRPGPNSDQRYTMTEWDGIPRPTRVPFIITTQYRLEKGVPLWPRGSGGTNSDEAKQNQFIIFRINPNQLHISQALRGAEAKTRVGTVYYVWQDPLKRSFFDEPTVGITFDSGNLFPWTWLNKLPFGGAIPDTLPIPPGIETFYRFMSLLNEGKVMPDGRPNFIYITCNTRKFPQLTLAGWFTPEGVSSVTDSADDPHHLTWTANFHCRATYPRLYNSGELLAVFRQMENTLPRPRVLRAPPGQETEPNFANALEAVRQLGTPGTTGV